MDTGWICGGYASTEWSPESGTLGVWGNYTLKDENTFLFVIRPKDKRNIFHRKRDDDGNLLQPNGGLVWNPSDGFNFGYNTLYWGNGRYWAMTGIYVNSEHPQNKSHEYYDLESAVDIVGQNEYPQPNWKDFEVFQLVAPE